MSHNDEESDWKLKLRHGGITTPYSHFTALAEGIAEKLSDGFSCRPGPAFMGMKTWASSSSESADMINVIGRKLGFSVTGSIQIYETDPAQPPRESPFGYDINFTPFDADADDDEVGTAP